MAIKTTKSTSNFYGVVSFRIPSDHDDRQLPKQHRTNIIYRNLKVKSDINRVFERYWNCILQGYISDIYFVDVKMKQKVSPEYMRGVLN